ncbi:hypothetical protein PoB_001789900 [Plakobranchus ocellatus]|uniref:Uncharacterized protein n=1 Tax=Plakobranchus ocellatus TaxID=259542 RepID=A0AAV3Z7U0_9GAST|nr:hypothetical protein PoB_001789900 [Plakobranchus ocellatus]
MMVVVIHCWCHYEQCLVSLKRVSSIQAIHPHGLLFFRRSDVLVYQMAYNADKKKTYLWLLRNQGQRGTKTGKFSSEHLFRYCPSREDAGVVVKKRTFFALLVTFNFT